MIDWNYVTEWYIRRTQGAQAPQQAKEPSTSSAFSREAVRAADSDEIGNWIASIMSRPAPPIFRLVEPDRPRIESDDIFRLQNLQSEVRANRRQDSGVLELRMQGSHQFPSPAIAPFVEELEQVAMREDSRSYRMVDDPGSQLVLIEFRSLIEQELPVIGPGGRVTIYQGAEWMEGDFVTRRRSTAMPSQWRGTQAILSRLKLEIAGQESDIEVTADFGYLELSKYERQTWMRPAFLFVLQDIRTTEPRVPWVYTLAEPATSSAELALEEGLGGWGEPGMIV